ncbi:MAG TPA: c-type cytochrome domain-containing protein [Verrucomicrobiae bacterium]
MKNSLKTSLQKSVLLAGIFALVSTFFLTEAFASGGGAKPAETFSWAAFLGPFHTVVLHLPIGFMTIALVLEALHFFQPADLLRKVIRLILVLTALTAALAAGLGWMRGLGADYDPVTLDRHRWAGVAFAVVTGITAALSFALGKARAIRGLYFAFIGLCMGVMTITGHLGGNLTHGSTYLTENAPEFIKKLAGGKSTTAIVEPPKDEATKYYVEHIKPLFEAKCFSCHGPEKQKGDLRLDVREAVLKGGDSGEPAVKLDDPAASYLLRLVMMPPDHDDVMPPSGKGTVSEEEIMKLIRWIRAGAVYPEAVPSVATNASGTAAR